MKESKLNGVINSSLSSIKDIFDSNTVAGEPITAAGGTVIIPISKVSVGLVSGGIDYYGKRVTPNDSNANFGGGGTTGVTLNPIGFLVTKADGSVEFLSVSAPASSVPDKIDNIASIIEKSPDIIERIKSIFSKKNNEAKEQANEESNTSEN